MYWIHMLLFFFFQAEDGIRDLTVTGVQTCTLPICVDHHRGIPDGRRDVRRIVDRRLEGNQRIRHDAAPRSEERRVGKEGRYRWPGDDQKKRFGQDSCRDISRLKLITHTRYYRQSCD